MMDCASNSAAGSRFPVPGGGIVIFLPPNRPVPLVVVPWMLFASPIYPHFQCFFTCVCYIYDSRYSDVVSSLCVRKSLLFTAYPVCFPLP